MNRTIRIFVSSPGDVSKERQVVGKVIAQLQGKYWSFVRLEDVFWESKAIRATAHFQDELIHPGDCDIVLGVLWSRLGSPLPEKFNCLNNLSRTGTEWELEEAFRTFDENAGEKPDILIYRRRAERPTYNDPEKEEESKRQWESLTEYIDRNYFNEDANRTIKRPIKSYRDLEAFESQLRVNLEELILRRIPSLKAGDEPPPISGCPFKELQAFDYHDRDRFFGRTREIRNVQEKLRKRSEQGTAFVLIYGGSGYGKSSLMRAGVAPVVCRDGGVANGAKVWRRILMQPSSGTGPLLERFARHLFADPSERDLEEADQIEDFPLSGLAEMRSETLPSGVRGTEGAEEKWDVANLSRQLADEEDFIFAVAAIQECLERNDIHLFLQLDQFEEALRDPFDEAEAGHFFTVIHAFCRCSRIWGLATLRSDSFPEIAKRPTLKSLVGEQGGHILPPPDSQMLYEIIRFPAMAARLEYETRIEPIEIAGEPAVADNLADQIYRDAKDNPDALPLLEFCLTQLWDKGQNLDTPDNKSLLCWERYKEFEGLFGAIATVADETVSRLRKTEWTDEARGRLFSALVRVDPSSGVVSRRRADLEALEKDDQLAPLVEALLGKRLLATNRDKSQDNPQVFLAHDSLIGHWTVLAGWITEHRADLAALERLIAEASQWHSERKNKGLLIGETRLAEAERVHDSGLFHLGATEKEFLRLSRSKTNRRLRFFQGVAVVFAIVAAIAMAAGLIAQKQTEIAVEQRDRADRERNEAEGLVNFLAFEIQPDLIRYTPLEMRNRMLSKVDQYYETTGTDRDWEAKNTLIQHWQMTAESMRTAGDIVAALGYEERAFDLSEELVEDLDQHDEESPDEFFIRLNHAISHSRLGGFLNLLQRHDEALDILDEGNQLFRQLEMSYPTDPKLLEAYSSLLRSRARTKLLSKETGGALADAEKALDLLKRKTLDNFFESQRPDDIALCREILGDIHSQNGNYSEAIAEYRKMIALFKSRRGKGDASAVLESNLAIVNGKIGSLFRLDGQKELALVHLENAVEILKRLSSDDPENAQYRSALNFSRSQLSSLANSKTDYPSDGDGTAGKDYLEEWKSTAALVKRSTEAGNTSEAVQLVQGAIESHLAILANDPNNPFSTDILSRAYSALSDLYDSMEEPAKFSAALEDKLQLERKAVERFPDSKERGTALRNSLLEYGDHLLATNRTADAIETFNELRSLCVQLNEAPDSGPDQIYELAQAEERLALLYERTGRTDQASSHYRAFAKAALQLHLSDPNNEKFLRICTGAHYRFGSVELELGNNEDALNLFQQVVTIVPPPGQRPNQLPDYFLSVATAHEKIGDILFEKGDKETAVEQWRVVHEIAEILNSDAPGATGPLGVLVRVSGKLAERIIESGSDEANLAEAQELVNAARKTVSTFHEISEKTELSAAWEIRLEALASRIGLAMYGEPTLEDRAVAFDEDPSNLEAFLRLSMLLEQRLQTAVSEKDNARIIDWADQLVAVFDRAAANDNPGSEIEQVKLITGQILGLQSHFLLLENERERAGKAARRAMTFLGEKPYLELNLAHSLLLLDKFDDAEEIYLRHRGKGLESNGEKLAWETGVRNDFLSLREKGIEHPDMARIAKSLDFSIELD